VASANGLSKQPDTAPAGAAEASPNQPAAGSGLLSVSQLSPRTVFACLPLGSQASVLAPSPHHPFAPPREPPHRSHPSRASIPDHPTVCVHLLHLQFKNPRTPKPSPASSPLRSRPTPQKPPPSHTSHSSQLVRPARGRHPRSNRGAQEGPINTPDCVHSIDA